MLYQTLPLIKIGKQTRMKNKDLYTLTCQLCDLFFPYRAFHIVMGVLWACYKPVYSHLFKSSFFYLIEYILWYEFEFWGRIEYEHLCKMFLCNDK